MKRLEGRRRLSLRSADEVRHRLSGMALSLLASLLLFSAPEDPALLQGLDPAGRRMLAPIRERALQPAALVAALGLRGDEQVADVGAGPGFYSLPLATRLPRGHLIATDVDSVALGVLRRRAQAAGLTNIETRSVTADSPGLSPASIDLVFLSQVDHYLPDRTTYFRQLAIALKPGGRLVIANYDRYREPDREAAAAAALTPGGEIPSAPGHFVLVWKRGVGP